MKKKDALVPSGTGNALPVSVGSDMANKAVMDYGNACKLAVDLQAGGMLPLTKAGQSAVTPQQMAMAILTGWDFDLSLPVIMNKIAVVYGKPYMEASLKVALLHKLAPNATFRLTGDPTSEGCSIEAARPGEKPVTFSITWDEIKDSRVVKETTGALKPNYRDPFFRKDMLFYRLATRVMERLFPDIIYVGTLQLADEDYIDVTPAQEEPVLAEAPQPEPDTPQMESEGPVEAQAEVPQPKPTQDKEKGKSGLSPEMKDKNKLLHAAIKDFIKKSPLELTVSEIDKKLKILTEERNDKGRPIEGTGFTRFPVDNEAVLDKALRDINDQIDTIDFKG